MNKIIDCKSLREFIDLVESHKCCPNPIISNWNRSEFPSIFKIGFKCYICGQVWSLGLSSLKKSTRFLQDEGISLIHECNKLAKNKNGQILCDDFIKSLHRF